MTREQFEDIQNKLAKWREVRGLSVEDQKENFEVNYTKELLEFFEAERENDEYGMIDALCDMIVVALNAGQSQGIYEEEFSHCNLTKPLREINSGVYCLEIELLKLGYDPYKCLLETIKELETRTGKWNEKEGKWIKDKGAYTLEGVKELYPPKSYNRVNVFEEDKDFWYIGLSEYDIGTLAKVKKWYKADYSKCKND